jgi:hypothetical protein
VNIGATLLHLAPGSEWVLSGETYDDLVWISGKQKPSLSDCEKAWKQIKIDYLLRPIRAERDALLISSDWTQLSDAPVNAKAWAAYRQALRDLPESITDPTQTITWPEPPK